MSHGAPDSAKRPEQDESEPAPTGESRRNKMARGVRVSFVSLAARQASRIGLGWVLAVLLGPEQFGIVGMAMLYVTFSSIFLDMGLGTALIQKRELNDRDSGTVFWMNLTVAIALVLLTLVFAPAIAAFFRTPELTRLLQILSFTLLLKATIVVPVALLTREMRFGVLSLIEASGTLAAATVGVVAAALGAGYWTVAFNVFTLDVINAVALVLVAGAHGYLFSRQSAKELMPFGAHVLGSSLIAFASRNADNMIVARFLGVEDLAYYQLSYRFLLLPLQTIGEVLQRVLYPALCEMQDKRTLLRSQFLRAVKAMSAVSFPAMGLLAVAAPLAVPLGFGDEWMPAVRPMQVLAFAGMVQSVQLQGLVMLSTGKASWQFRYMVVSLGASLIGWFAGLPWGVTGVATGYLISLLCIWPLAIALEIRLTGGTIREHLRELVPAASATVALMATWLLVDWLLPAGMNSVLRLAVDILVSVSAYAAVSWGIWRRDARDVLEIMWAVVGRRKAVVGTTA